jgi:mannose/cellobiose epimerase-like protein (N-acyl-D-glucosamine 2-epimerase family)
VNPPAEGFADTAFLRRHAASIVTFYDGRSLDPSGGHFHFFNDDGQVFDRHSRHLVSSTRFVFTYATAARQLPQHPRAAAWRAAAAHGLDFVQRAHFDAATGGYRWTLHWDGREALATDATHHCYGLAFVLLAHAHALIAGLDDARAGIASTHALMEQRFWEPHQGLYADDATPSWQLSSYRGQNANMHACEALLAAFDATQDERYLERAATVAESVTARLARFDDAGRIWEHYRVDPDSGQWRPDWDYNRRDSSNIFRPWGFQPGHFVEWAKLLATLERTLPAQSAHRWMLPRAEALFALALPAAWDAQHGGMVYGLAPDGSVCDGQKYHWVQAEAIGAAAALARRSAQQRQQDYSSWYERLWSYAWQHFVDHDHGAWFRILDADNRRITDQKSPAGKTDYHTLGACWEALAALPALKPR